MMLMIDPPLEENAIADDNIIATDISRMFLIVWLLSLWITLTYFVDYTVQHSSLSKGRAVKRKCKNRA